MAPPDPEPDTDPDPVITFDRTGDRYRLLLNGEEAAFASYARVGTTVELPHTVTLPRFRGRGLAALLVEHTLDELAAESLTVIPSCWFVARFIAEHPARYRTLTSER